MSLQAVRAFFETPVILACVNQGVPFVAENQPLLTSAADTEQCRHLGIGLGSEGRNGSGHETTRTDRFPRIAKGPANGGPFAEARLAQRALFTSS